MHICDIYFFVSHTSIIAYAILYQVFKCIFLMNCFSLREFLHHETAAVARGTGREPLILIRRVCGLLFFRRCRGASAGAEACLSCRAPAGMRRARKVFGSYVLGSFIIHLISTVTVAIWHFSLLIYFVELSLFYFWWSAASWLLALSLILRTSFLIA